MKKYYLILLSIMLSACTLPEKYTLSDSLNTATLTVKLKPTFGDSDVVALVYSKDSTGCEAKKIRLVDDIQLTSGRPEFSGEIDPLKFFVFDVYTFTFMDDSGSTCYAKFQPQRNKQYEAHINYDRDAGCSITVHDKNEERKNIATMFSC